MLLCTAFVSSNAAICLRMACTVPHALLPVQAGLEGEAALEITHLLGATLWVAAGDADTAGDDLMLVICIGVMAVRLPF